MGIQETHQSKVALSSEGIVCLFYTDQPIKFIKIDNFKGLVMDRFENIIACGHSNGVIRCIDINSDQYEQMLRPPPLGKGNVLKGQKLRAHKTDSFADVIGLVLFHSGSKMLALYSDRTVLVWDRLQKVILRSFLCHADSINDI